MTRTSEQAFATFAALLRVKNQASTGIKAHWQGSTGFPPARFRVPFESRSMEYGVVPRTLFMGSFRPGNAASRRLLAIPLSLLTARMEPAPKSSRSTNPEAKCAIMGPKS